MHLQTAREAYYVVINSQIAIMLTNYVGHDILTSSIQHAEDGTSVIVLDVSC